ncbi:MULTISPECIES: hypothetical protein [unclassified Mycoplasma]|nr:MULTISPECIES: hypothetical protein [unclassified Mycoplasma]MCU4706990.1 hypothetical protein [Mycoplasma sp. CSL7503-lung]
MLDKEILEMFSEKTFKKVSKRIKQYEPENEEAFEIIFRKLAEM